MRRNIQTFVQTQYTDQEKLRGRSRAGTEPARRTPCLTWISSSQPSSLTSHPPNGGAWLLRRADDQNLHGRLRQKGRDETRKPHGLRHARSHSCLRAVECSRAVEAGHQHHGAAHGRRTRGHRLVIGVISARPDTTPTAPSNLRPTRPHVRPRLRCPRTAARSARPQGAGRIRRAHALRSAQGPRPAAFSCQAPSSFGLAHRSEKTQTAHIEKVIRRTSGQGTL